MSEKKYPRIVMNLFSYAGVHELTHECVISEIMYASSRGIQLGYSRISGDALIERSRSRALGNFYKSNLGDVLVMIDHDISWRPGDACEVARLAFEKNALVGGLYCKRAMKRGWASRPKNMHAVEFGADNDNTLDADGVATGFLAIPRSIVETLVTKLDIDSPALQAELKNAMAERDIEKVSKLMDMSLGYIQDGAYRQAEHHYWDFFRCNRRRVYANGNPLNQHEFLSEDWAFCDRVKFCGFETLLSTRPILGHTGDYCYHITDGMDDTDLKRAEEHKKAA